MRIFNQEKTEELQSVDQTKGYLVNDKLFVRHIEPVQEQGHYETIKEYENGGKDVEWIVDVEGVEEHDEFEDIQVFIPYTAQELAQIRIDELKNLLAGTDYAAIKYAEGELTTEEYAPMKTQRHSWRQEINELEKEL